MKRAIVIPPQGKTVGAWKTTMAFPGEGWYWHVAPQRFRQSILEHGLDYSKQEDDPHGWSVTRKGNYLTRSNAVASTQKLYGEEPFDLWAVNTDGLTLYGDLNDQSWLGEDEEPEASWVYTEEPIGPERLELSNHRDPEFVFLEEPDRQYARTAGLWEHTSPFQIPKSVEQAYLNAGECPHCHSNLLMNAPPPRENHKLYCPVCGWKPSEEKISSYTLDLQALVKQLETADEQEDYEKVYQLAQNLEAETNHLYQQSMDHDYNSKLRDQWFRFLGLTGTWKSIGHDAARALNTQWSDYTNQRHDAFLKLESAAKGIQTSYIQGNLKDFKKGMLRQYVDSKKQELRDNGSWEQLYQIMLNQKGEHQQWADAARDPEKAPGMMDGLMELGMLQNDPNYKKLQSAENRAEWLSRYVHDIQNLIPEMYEAEQNFLQTSHDQWHQRFIEPQIYVKDSPYAQSPAEWMKFEPEPRQDLTLPDAWSKQADWRDEEYLYHLAPTIDRERIRAHGLIPADPGINPKWEGPYGENNFKGQQPEAIYVLPDLDKAKTYRRLLSDPSDVWAIPTSQIKEIGGDEYSDGYTIHHPVSAELVHPYEHVLDDIRENPYQQWWQPVLDRRPELGIGQPTSKIARHVPVELKEENVFHQGTGMLTREMVEAIRRTLGGVEVKIINAYDGDRMVGSIVYFVLEDRTLLTMVPGAPQEPVVWVEWVWVDPEYRDSDVFFQLAEPVKQLAQQTGYPVEAYYQNERLKRVMDRYFKRPVLMSKCNPWHGHVAAAPTWNPYTPNHIDPNPIGMPRPLFENQPVPWTSEINIPEGGNYYDADHETVIPNFSVADPQKIRDCWVHNLCVLCGELLTDPVAVIPASPVDDQFLIIDGPLHPRCAKMTKAHCPHIRDGGFSVYTMPLADWDRGKGDNSPGDFYVQTFGNPQVVKIATEFDTPPLENPVNYGFVPFTDQELEYWQSLPKKLQSRYKRQANHLNQRAKKKDGVSGTVVGRDLALLANRYQGKCAYCGLPGADSWDHVIPMGQMGQNEIQNLLPAHITCNNELNDWANRNRPYTSPNEDQMSPNWRVEPAEAKVATTDLDMAINSIFERGVREGQGLNEIAHHAMQFLQYTYGLTLNQAATAVTPLMDQWLQFHEQIRNKDEKGEVGEDAPYDVQWTDMIPDLPGKDWEEITPKRVGAVSWRKLEPHPELRDLAQSYMDSKGWDYDPPRTYPEVDESRAKGIADEYDQMAHTPNDPYVRSAYSALAQETLEQYKHLVQAGYHFEYDSVPDSHYSSPWDAARDVRDNKHMYVFPTSAGYGNNVDSYDTKDHPLLLKVPGLMWNHQPVTYNDLFRAVHDVFGHAKEGVGFRHHGEENAWRQHSAMYSDMARRALTSETRGQNSWVNFGPYGAHNQMANNEDTIYAPQKAGLLPEWVTWEGAHDHYSKVGVSNALDFMDFFDQATRGEHQPTRFPHAQFSDPEHQQFYDAQKQHGGHFDDHIETSIPGYREMMTKKGVAITKMYGPDASVLDIAGGEGSWGKAISQTGGQRTVTLDANPEMNQHFQKTQVPNAELAAQSYLDPFSYQGVDYPVYNPTERFDVVNESMGFQFMSPDRARQIAEAKRLLKPDGLFFADEKVITDDFRQNEQIKDKWKNQFYTPEQLAEKQRVVNVQGEPSSGMMANMATQEQLEQLLRANFAYVEQYWQSGNFIGYVASDNPAQLKTFLAAL